MSQSPPVSTEDQQFLALLVHRGFLQKPEAVQALQTAAQGVSIDDALKTVAGWETDRVEYLRRTKAMKEPEIPGYIVERRLGAGGTSEVHAARSKKEHKRVALKILRPNLALDPPAVRRFVEEAKLLGRLDHPAVVKGKRVFRFLGTYILEMEFVPGRTLEEFLDEGKTFSEEEALSIIVKTAEALTYLHEQGVVHRDLKPGNLMIDAKNSVKLIDLGFAGRGMEGRVDDDSTLGTPAYLSPEQARGENNLDSRADIYSLGATLYHLVIGKLPFKGGDDSEMMRAQVLDGLNGMALKGTDISPSLHYFIEKMMAKDRESRFASPAELAEDIRAHQKRQRDLA